jgi:hypothetical protein
MAIKRYRANSDNTIVSTYKSNMSTRATGSNAGQADVVEVYSIYGRQTTGSQELSRVLMNFPVSTISSDRSAGRIPSSGSVKFYLKLHSAATSKTVPRNFKMVVQPVSRSWQEGDGLDLENYRDLTKNGTGSNWVNAGNIGDAEVTNVQFVTDTIASYRSKYVLITDSHRRRYAYYFTDAGGGAAPSVAANEVEVALGALTGAAEYANKFRLTVISSSAAVSGSLLGKDTAARWKQARVTNLTGGAVQASYRTPSLSDDTVIVVSTPTSGTGYGPWRNRGGDYLQGGRDGATGTGLTFTQNFANGLEDIEIDISKLVERWVSGKSSTHGVGVRLSASFEASASKAQASKDPNIIKNYNGAKTSYYTKRFFARGSEYFFKRPSIEARWNSTNKDQRGDFNFSSSLAPASLNMNTIFLYNYVRGQLKNIPNIGTGKIYVKLFSASSDTGKPNGVPLALHLPQSKSVANGPWTAVTGGYHSKGIYTASICLTQSNKRTVKNLFDVWYGKNLGQFFTGTIVAQKPSAMNNAREPVYYMNITNLQNAYAYNQNARFNLYIRNKYWSPTIYTKASSTPMTTTIESASYRVIRVIDNLEVIPHDTGSDFATGLSYDVSGNYFNLDMKLLQQGYEYGLRFAFYDAELGTWQEQDEAFNFRVNKNEY